MTSTKTAPLTIEDLAAALDDERHLGFGYATSRYLPDGYRAKLDAAVIAVASDLGMTREQLFHWDEPQGRPLARRCSLPSGKINRALVRGFMAPDEHLS